MPPAAATRAAYQQDLWHYTLAKMVDACAAAGIKPFYGPFGDFSDPAGLRGAVPQRLPDGLRRRLDAASRPRSPIAKRVFSPDPAEVAFAKKILAAMPDGTGAVMIDGKMQDDATWKQAKVLVDLARLVAAKDPDMAARYGAVTLTGARRNPGLCRAMTMNKTRTAKFKIGQVVRHRVFPFRGVIFDIDPEFNNTEEWYQSIPAEVRPHKDQPFYHLFAENAESEYIAYVSEQNLLPDTSGEPVRHPQVAEVFETGRQGQLSAAQFAAELSCHGRCRPQLCHSPKRNEARLQARLVVAFDTLIAAVGCLGWLSSFLRASSARRCSSSCSFFCCSSNTFGSVGGPS